MDKVSFHLHQKKKILATSATHHHQSKNDYLKSGLKISAGLYNIVCIIITFHHHLSYLRLLISRQLLYLLRMPLEHSVESNQINQLSHISLHQSIK